MSVEIETRTGHDSTVYGGVVAYLTLSDANAAGEFYKQAFGAEELRRHAAPDGKLMHLHLKINGGSLFLMDAFPEHGGAYREPAGYMLHLQVEDVEAWWKRAVDTGRLDVKSELQDMFWGDRWGWFVDPYGVSWSMGMPLGK
jgi:uncharacterized glyoxalase superfamily protein PhnB